MTEPLPPVRPAPRPPARVVFDVNLALKAAVKLIVSRDRDLLDLMDATRGDAREFQLRFPMLRILDPVELLRELDTRNSP